MSLFNSPDYRLLCEAAGATYCGTHNSEVVFKDPRDGATLRLWTFACKSPDDIAMAIKNHREPVQDFQPLLPSEKI